LRGFPSTERDYLKLPYKEQVTIKLTFFAILAHYQAILKIDLYLLFEPPPPCPPPPDSEPVTKNTALLLQPPPWRVLPPFLRAPPPSQILKEDQQLLSTNNRFSVVFIFEHVYYAREVLEPKPTGYH
jgi:hypothetical protein